jgi:glutamyl-tRNA synthetase
MTIRTRFAPSPTGYLHIGTARTALFSWLFARHHGGKALLRIEDTDKARSTQAAVDAIYHGLAWLGLDWDEEPVLQSSRAARHQQVALELLEKGCAYKCYATPEELEEMRHTAQAEGRTTFYDRRWREPQQATPQGIPPVIRLKMPLEGETVIADAVQGRVTVANSQLDDFVLLRSDGSPTYMLSVVVDDHDMGITHIIRGDDHLNNAFRQYHLFQAMEWDIPVFAHIPLIHGADGAKLSKRHGALGVESYHQMGFLPEAICNYLLRLGWGHGDAEIISREQAINWFSLEKIGKAASRFDMAKLTALNAHYMKEKPPQELYALLEPFLFEKYHGLSGEQEHWLRQGLPALQERGKTMLELADMAGIYAGMPPFTLTEKGKAAWTVEVKAQLSTLEQALASVAPWDKETLEHTLKAFAEAHGLKLGAVMMPLRLALTGDMASPSVFEIMAILGKAETLFRVGARLKD